MTRALTADDDRHHPVGDPHPHWTETTWWGFSVPERAIGGMVYTLFRPNLGVASVQVSVWDAGAVEPWRAPYHREQWHLPYPATDLDDTELGGLRLRCLEPLRSYELGYADGEALQLELRFDAAMEPHVPMAEPVAGHFDQLGRVSGSMVLSGQRADIDCLAIRDRSWYVRDDTRSLLAGYLYGAADEGHHFLAFSHPDGTSETSPVVGGYLVRDGQKATLTGGMRTVASRRRGHPDEVVLEAADELGRPLSASGRVSASLASQSTPGMFAWMSIVDWTIDGRPGHGEDHDVWSPDQLSRPPSGR